VNNRALIFTPDGRSLLDATNDGKVTVRDAVSGKAVREVPACVQAGADRGGWDALTFSPDGRRLFASKEGCGARLLAWPAGTVLWQSTESSCAASSPDGRRLVTGNWNRKTFFRDPKTGAERSEVPGESLTSATFSPDGRRLATAHLFGTWRVHDATTGAVLKELTGCRHFWCVAFSPTGWLLAVAGDNSVRVYDTATWAEVARLDGHEATVGAVFFGPDDATLVSASAEDGTALVWSLRPTADRALPEPERLWADLAGDGAAVRRAVWAAAAHPELAVKLFRQKWPPERPADAGRLRKLVAGLDGDTFEAREASEADLAKLGRRAEPVLRKALAETTSPEVKRRAARLLARWAAPAGAEYPAGQARELRAVWALELAGTPEAKKLLEEWAGAGAGERLCEAADGALKRLRRGAR
jgi:hypothetical protein